jgi:hypothetical protein
VNCIRNCTFQFYAASNQSDALVVCNLSFLEVLVPIVVQLQGELSHAVFGRFLVKWYASVFCCVQFYFIQDELLSG